MPDFDVDFCMDGRIGNRIRGREVRSQRVSQIITFGSMAAKSRGRRRGAGAGQVLRLADRLSKMIPFEVGMTLEKAYEQEEILARLHQGR